MTDDTWTPAQYQQYLKTGIAPMPAPPPTPRRIAVHEPPALELLAKARMLARQHGWLGYGHTDTDGAPELMLVRPGELVLLLFKGRGAKLTQEQAIWHSLLESVPGIEPTVVTPQTWTHVEWRLTQPGRKETP